MKSSRLAFLMLTMMWTVCALAGEEPSGSDETWQVDPVHSSVVFRIMHLNTSPFYGMFNDIAGTIVLGDQPSFRFSIPVASLDTRHPDRDHHLKNPDFFNAEVFPDLTFQSTAVTVEGDRYHVTGDLTLLGVTRPVTVTLIHTGRAEHEHAGRIIGFETTFTLRRSEFAMTYGLDALGDEVTLMIGLEANQPREQPQAQ